MVFPTSVPQFRAVVDMEGQFSHTFLRQLDDIAGNIDRSVRGIARFHTIVSRIGEFPQFRKLAGYLRQIQQVNNQISRERNAGRLPSPALLASRDNLIRGVPDPDTGVRSGGLLTEVGRQRELLKDQSFAANNLRAVERQTAREIEAASRQRIKDSDILLQKARQQRMLAVETAGDIGDTTANRRARQLLGYARQRETIQIRQAEARARETKLEVDARRVEQLRARRTENTDKARLAVEKRIQQVTKETSRQRIRDSQTALDISRKIRETAIQRIGDADNKREEQAAKRLLAFSEDIEKSQARRTMQRARQTKLADDQNRADKLGMNLSRQLAQNQRDVADASDRALERRIAGQRRADRISAGRAQERIDVLERAQRTLRDRAQTFIDNREFRRARRVLDARRRITQEIRRQRVELARLLPDTARIGRHLLDWREVAGQFVNRVLEAISRNRELRDAIIGVGIALAGIIGGARLFGALFRGASERARLIQRAVLRGGLIDRGYSQSLARAIALRGATREDSTEFVAQTLSGFRADVGDPVERQNIQNEVNRLGVTQEEFDIGKIANLPDKQVFEEIFRLAQEVYNRGAGAAGVATLGKVLGIDEQEARTLTHLVQSRGGITRLIEDINAYRPVAEETTLANLELSATFVDMALQAGNFSDTILATFAPALINIIGFVRDIFIGMRGWAEENRRWVRFFSAVMVGALVGLVTYLIAVRVRLLLQAKAWLIVNTLMIANAILTGQWHKVAAAAAISAAVLAGGLTFLALELNATEDAYDRETKAIMRNTEAMRENNALMDDRFNILRLLERKAIFDVGRVEAPTPQPYPIEIEYPLANVVSPTPENRVGSLTTPGGAVVESVVEPAIEDIVNALNTSSQAQQQASQAQADASTQVAGEVVRAVDTLIRFLTSGYAAPSPSVPQQVVVQQQQGSSDTDDIILDITGP